jgi:uncharacterized protein (TIGR02118 family)
MMIKVSILYPSKPGSRFDVDYYLNVHMPLAIKLLEPALKGVSVEIGVSGAMPDQAPPYAAIVGFTCESAQAFSDAFIPVAAELQGDIPNFTDIEPVIQISEIKISQ